MGSCSSFTQNVRSQGEVAYISAKMSQDVWEDSVFGLRHPSSCCCCCCHGCPSWRQNYSASVRPSVRSFLTRLHDDVAFRHDFQFGAESRHRVSRRVASASRRRLSQSFRCNFPSSHLDSLSPSPSWWWP